MSAISNSGDRSFYAPIIQSIGQGGTMQNNEGGIDDLAYFLTLVIMQVDSNLKPEYVFEVLLQMLVDMEQGLPMMEGVALEIGEAIVATKDLPAKASRH